MKVVLFCGGLGTRMREYSETIPKPMVQIGYRPIIWHVMKYYAHYGHKDFVLCLGYKADVIKNYFRNYDECISNDFVLSGGGKNLELLHSDIDDWRITFVDTGLNSNIGMRLKAVEKHVQDEEVFLAHVHLVLALVDVHQRAPGAGGAHVEPLPVVGGRDHQGPPSVVKEGPAPNRPGCPFGGVRRRRGRPSGGPKSPSKIDSRGDRIKVKGVRSSWDTFAKNSSLTRSASRRWVDICWKVRASSPISSLDCTVKKNSPSFCPSVRANSPRKYS